MEEVQQSFLQDVLDAHPEAKSTAAPWKLTAKPCAHKEGDAMPIGGLVQFGKSNVMSKDALAELGLKVGSTVVAKNGDSTREYTIEDVDNKCNVVLKARLDNKKRAATFSIPTGRLADEYQVG
eukprot:9498326-Pyramimonas_sp.AAC.2